MACFGPAGGYGAFQAEAATRLLTLIPERPPPMPSFPPKRGEERDYLVARGLFDFGPPSALYLSVRAGRRRWRCGLTTPRPTKPSPRRIWS